MLEDVTFAIPTYNRNEYLERLLDSIPNNLGAKFAISDNGSFVIEKTLLKHSGNIEIISSKNVIEMYENWNMAISMVQTKWFLIPSDDDLYYSETIKSLHNAIKVYPDADILFFGHNVINEDDKILSTWVPPKEGIFNAPEGFEFFKYGVDARFPCIIFRTEFVKKLGGIDSTYLFTAGDSLLIQKCLIHGKSVFIKEVVGAYRTWAKNFTNQLIASKRWLDKIDRWQDEIAIELENAGISIAENLKDEVYAQNLLSAFEVMRNNHKNLFDRISFLSENRFPWGAKYTTKFRVLKRLMFG